MSIVCRHSRRLESILNFERHGLDNVTYLLTCATHIHVYSS